MIATGSNWNGSGISAGKAENFSHVEARNIYLTGKSPKDAESSKIASKHQPPRGSCKYATKVYQIYIR